MMPPVPTQCTALPFVDEHAVVIATDAGDVWTALLDGLGGAVYRALVIGSRGHRLGLRRLLSGMQRRAEDR
jgi:hypothetical protein